MQNHGSMATGASWALHDLGLAAAFGGSLFGKLALNPAVKSLKTEERSLVLKSAWNDFSIIDTVSVVTAGVTWLVGRTMLSGKEVTKAARPLVIAKDVLIATTVVTGAANIISGIANDRSSQPNEGKSYSARENQNQNQNENQNQDPKKTNGLKVLRNVMGTIHLASLAGVIALTAGLATQAGKSMRWSFVSRFLP